MLIIAAARLAHALIDSEMSESELCARAGVGHQTFAKMLRGRTVRFSSIRRICRELGIPPKEIIKWIADEAEAPQPASGKIARPVQELGPVKARA